MRTVVTDELLWKSYREKIEPSARIVAVEVVEAICTTSGHFEWASPPKTCGLKMGPQNQYELVSRVAQANPKDAKLAKDQGAFANIQNKPLPTAPHHISVDIRPPYVWSC